jgi:hypothetical protein
MDYLDQKLGELRVKIDRIKQPVVKKVEGRVYEEFGTNLNVTGADFLRGAFVTIEGHGGNDGGPFELPTEFISENRLVAFTDAENVDYGLLDSSW